MALDALCLAAVARELRADVLGGKVDKVYQPGPNEVVLAMRAGRENVRLLLSAEPGSARAHLTYVNQENPAQPPVLCMLLRKHLTGGRLVDLSQPQDERILRFTFQCTDELGDTVDRHLILEAMGRAANLMLTDGEDRILACTRRVYGDVTTGKRQIAPGALYRPPDPHPGVPPLLRRELEFRGKEVEEGIAQLRGDIDAGRYTPTLLVRDGQGVDFSFLPILQYGPQTECVPFPTFAALLDHFYAHRDRDQRVRQRGGDLLKTVQSLKERTVRKVANQTRELAAARDRERFREEGDLLTANLYRLAKGMREAVVEDFYHDNAPRIIPLDPLLTLQQNAARCYKAYTKAKTAETALTGQIAKGEEDLAYLDSVLESISLSESDRDLNEIRRELEETGYLRRKKSGKKEMKAPAKLLELRTPSGKRVTVGRNNTQNDKLTLKMAGKTDWWFHAQKTHGAHVILWTQGEDPTDGELEVCAQLAAYYSQARSAPKTPVDYTQVKFIKKPQGGKPGAVIYSAYQTVVVEPKPPST